MTLNGVAGRVYAIEQSLDLLNWNPLDTVTNTGPTSTFTDPGAAGQSRRFYRARTVTP